MRCNAISLPNAFALNHQGRPSPDFTSQAVTDNGIISLEGADMLALPGVVALKLQHSQ